MSLGISHEKQTKVNLTRLRINTRNINQKKSGRKRLRPGDYDVTPCMWTECLLVEITAAAAYLGKPVFVAIRRSEDQSSDYYWAKYSATSKDRSWIYPTDLPRISTDQPHLEICHSTGHYDVVLTVGGSYHLLHSL